MEDPSSLGFRIASRELPRMGIVNRTDFLVEFCRGKRVLHLGAVDRFGGDLCGLHSRIMQTAESVLGIDSDVDGIALAKSRGINNIVPGDVEQLKGHVVGQFNPDIVLASEVLEHLSSPGLFLESLGRFAPRAILVVTTPNCYAGYRFLYPLVGRETIHPEHVSFHSYSTLQALLLRFGFQILEEYGYVLPGRFERLLKVACRPFPHFASGLIAVASFNGSVQDPR